MLKYLPGSLKCSQYLSNCIKLLLYSVIISPADEKIYSQETDVVATVRISLAISLRCGY